mgnify:CR=1 FL=1
MIEFCYVYGDNLVMRRKDREILDLDKIESIIAGARYMHLGMFDENYPYVVPFIMDMK